MRHYTARKRGFTMIELLVVIAIIAILAAILFPVFATIREQARQSSTMSHMQSIYQGVKLYYEDEQAYPRSLFGYVQTCTLDNNVCMPNSTRLAITPGEMLLPQHPTFPMQQTIIVNPLYPYLFRNQVKDLPTFYSGDEEVTDGKAFTYAYYPPNSPLGGNTIIKSDGTLDPASLPVRWRVDGTVGSCNIHGDPDMPNPLFAGLPKLFYKMDSMDVGPLLDSQGRWVVDGQGAKVYALHYTPDWTGKAGAACDTDRNRNDAPYVAQLKYKNPPTERTIITYNTHHAAIGNSGRVMVLFLDGRAKKVDLKTALQTFPLNYGL